MAQTQDICLDSTEGGKIGILYFALAIKNTPTHTDTVLLKMQMS